MLKFLANMVLTTVVPYVASKTADLAKHKVVKKTLGKQFDAVVADAAPSITAGGKAVLTQPFANRKNRRMAEQTALQTIGGTYQRVIIARDWYWVVWQDETPFEVYPPLPEGAEPLAECRELKNFRGDRIDPSADPPSA